MPERTLRGRLYLLLAQWLVVFLAVSGLIGAFALHHMRTHVEQDRLLLARTVAHHVDSTVLGARQGAARLAAELPSPETSLSSVRSQLRSFRFQSPFRSAIHLLGPDGEVLVSDPPFAPPPPEVPPARGLGGGVSPLVPKGDRAVLLLSHPFERGGRDYILVAEMSPRGSVLSTVLQNLAPEPQLHLVVIDSTATVVAAPDHEQLFRVVAPADRLGARIRARRPLVTVASTCTICVGPPATGDYLTVMVPLQNAPWGVAIQQEEDEAFSVLRPSQVGFASTTLLLVVMALLLSRGLSRSVIEPIAQLSDRAERMSRGELDRPIEVEGDRELQVLAGSLDEAREQIARSLKELKALNEHLVQDAQRKVLVRRLLAAAEEERRRIARELHDEISQLLTAIQLSLERAGERPEELERVGELLARTQREVHRVIFDLRPSLLDDLGLPAAVRWYAERYLEREGLDVTLSVEEDLELPDEVEITVFRIYQEIVTNILRHAGAGHLTIELETAGEEGSERLVLSVEDDGVGFDPGAKTEGAGLVGMRERAALVGGTILIDSEPGLGTRVHLEIPLDREAPAPVAAAEGAAP